MLFGFIEDQDAAARFGDADHLPDGSCHVIEEVDASCVKYHVEARIRERQDLGIAQKQVGVELPATEVSLAAGQHLHREVNSVQPDAPREVLEIEPGSH